MEHKHFPPQFFKPFNRSVIKHIRNQKLKVAWPTMLGLNTLLAAGLIGAPVYFILTGHFTWWHFLMLFLSYWMTGLGITMGYHRLFAHKSFRAHPTLESILLFFGAMSLQNSALAWSSDHRTHHQFTDTERDPYNIGFGFWWAHILWIFFNHRKPFHLEKDSLDYRQKLMLKYPNAIDLIQNNRVRLQHRLYPYLAVVLSLGIPGALGLWFGDFWGHLFAGGFMRLALVYQSTFFINSLAHLMGKNTYSAHQSAKDSFWCAIFALGEGHHNFHHTYPSDFRNGVGTLKFDPTKWIIFACSKIGLAWDLKKQKINASRGAS